MPEVSGIWTVYERGEPALCPRCLTALQTDTWMSSHTLKVRKGHVIRDRFDQPKRVGEVEQKFDCRVRICACGTTYALDALVKNDTDPPPRIRRYSFSCYGCQCYRPTVDKNGYCISCVVERSCGVDNLHSLVDTLTESTGLHMGITRLQVLDGILHGLLIGAPGLTTPDP